jgi:hypothetical protein
MERHQASLSLQNAIRAHENNEKEIISTWGQILKIKFNYGHEIKTMKDIHRACKHIVENDTFNYVTDPNTETGLLLITLRNVQNKFYDTAIDLKARWDSEEALFKDNQEKEDKVLIRLTSIDNHIVQGNKEVRTLGKTSDQNDTPQIVIDIWNGGQCDNKRGEDGKFRCFLKAPEFVQWLYDNGYKEITGEFVYNTFSFKKSKVSLKSIKDYFSHRNL